MSTLVRLTIVAPRDLQEDLVEMLLRLQPPLGGFSAVDVEGHGQDFTRATTAERVRGRTARIMLIAVLDRARVDDVLAALDATVRGVQCAWWTEPVERFGRLG